MKYFFNLLLSAITSKGSLFFFNLIYLVKFIIMYFSNSSKISKIDTLFPYPQFKTKNFLLKLNVFSIILIRSSICIKSLLVDFFCISRDIETFFWSEKF